MQERRKGPREFDFTAKTDPHPTKHLQEESKLRLQDIQKLGKA